jgi:hypothetical protein
MAIALVAGQTGSTLGGNATSITVALTNNPTPGNFVVLCVTSATAATTITAKDSNNNTYTATSKTRFSGATGAVGIFYLPNTPANGTKTLTATFGTIGDVNGWAAEFSGVLAASPFENDASANSAANNTAIATPTYTSVADGVLYIGCCVAGQSITSANSPWTGIGAIRNGNYAEYFIQSAHGAQAVNYTQSPSGAWSGLVAAFKPALVGIAAKQLIVTRQSIHRAAYW